MGETVVARRELEDHGTSKYKHGREVLAVLMVFQMNDKWRRQVCGMLPAELAVTNYQVHRDWLSYKLACYVPTFSQLRTPVQLFFSAQTSIQYI